MPRPNRTFVGLCVGLIALSALVPGIAAFQYAVIDPQWVLLPDETLTLAPTIVPTGDEQLLPLLSVLPSRAPPLFSLA